MDTNMTDEQKKFLEECEEEFKDRYTEKDEAFMKIKLAEKSQPPIMDPWHNKPRKPHQDWRHGQGQNRRHQNWAHRNNERNDRVDRQRRHLYHSYWPY